MWNLFGKLVRIEQFRLWYSSVEILLRVVLLSVPNELNWISLLWQMRNPLHFRDVSNVNMLIFYIILTTIQPKLCLHEFVDKRLFLVTFLLANPHNGRVMQLSKQTSQCLGAIKVEQIQCIGCFCNGLMLTLCEICWENITTWKKVRLMIFKCCITIDKIDLYVSVAGWNENCMSRSQNESRYDRCELSPNTSPLLFHAHLLGLASRRSHRIIHSVLCQC